MYSVTRKMLRTSVPVVCAGIVFAGVACKPAAKEQAQAPPAIPAPVIVALVRAGPIAATPEVSGTVEPLEQAKIMPGAAGRVAKALLKEGDAVKVGQILFLVEQKQSASSQPTTGDAIRRPARRSTEVRSPLAGVVLAKFSSPGDMVTATPPTVMALVADIDLMKLTATGPEERFAEVRVGLEATVTTDGLPGRSFGGRVALVAPVEGATSKLNQVEILVENRDHALQPGMFAQARVFTAFKPRTILVPPAALIDGQVTVAEGGVARVRSVQTGIRTEAAVEVLGGVAPGDLVVVSGNKSLRDGARIVYKTP